ncbi:M96 mating-specific protein [Phytophthora megakarya]|uniref:M96 mating-specific protein n=1 Tax=Phytophthora megakarya TaxID=4795 RepID=A0A225VMB5_9STRA|nr:M96 mating-specific protein [Phytophthora megakarya]
MSSSAVFPPLNVRSTSGSRFLPHAQFPQNGDSDTERRNATALTIVELLARSGNGNTQQLPSLRPQNNANNSPLPSLPKMVIPSLRGDQRYAFPSSSGGVNYSTQTPTSTGVSPHRLSPAARPMPTPNTQTSAAPSPPKRGRAASASGAVNNSRKRQKDELTRLRAQVQELQRELEHVRARMPRKGRIVLTGIKTENHSPVATSSPLMGLENAGDATSGLMVVPVWERMAQHQKEEKSKAEMENLRLKGLIQEQLKISKGLEKLLRKRCKSSMSSGSDAETSAAVLGVKRPRTSDTEETAVFASLASGLEARLAEMETVFDKGGLTRDKQELQETQMILDERRGPVMEVKDAKILPFDVQSCASAIWECLEAESEATVVGGTTSDTLCFKNSVPLRQHRAPDAELIVRCVIRRVVDEATGRVVLVWESVAECPNRLPHVSATAKGVEIRDCGWGLLEPLRTATGEHSSILQLCSYLMPQLCGVSAEQSRQHTHGLAELVAPCYRGLWNKRQRTVENMLMNKAINAKNNKDIKQER